MKCEVLVIGGGPAGAAAAILLAREGRSVVVLEKAAFPRRKVCGELIAAAGLRWLAELGVGEQALREAGPEIRRIAVWAGSRALEAPMPAADAAAPYPRALARETLDALLLARAAHCGARVIQPATALCVARTTRGFACHAAAARGEGELHIEASAVIAAHGSWEAGALASQPRRMPSSSADLFGFKAQLLGGRVPQATVALAPFRAGYAGLVSRGGARSTFACCIQRGALVRVRREHPGVPAGEAVLRHALSQSAALRAAIGSAVPSGPWLASGPLRCGRRALCRDGIFLIGNAAAEAHPIVGEGIAMALQSAGLLARPLGRALAAGYSSACERAVATAYARDWQRLAARRLRASAALARLAMSPIAVVLAEQLLRRAPRILTQAARMSGKSPRGVIVPGA